MRKFVWAALLLAAAPLAAAPPSLRVDLARARGLTVGDPVDATLTVQLPAGSDLTARFPDWSSGWGDAQVLSFSPVERRSSPGGVELVQKVRLAAFRTGKIELPAKSVVVDSAPPETLHTPSDLALEVASVLPAHSTKLAPKPAAPPRRQRVPKAFWWTVGSLLLAAAAAALAPRRLRPPEARPAPALDPLSELQRSLDQLAELEPVVAHARLSLALRHFLGRSFTMPAAESTTTELARRLDGHGLEREVVRETVRLLREVDPIKFARRSTTREELSVRVERARSIASDVDRHLRPATEEPAA